MNATKSHTKPQRSIGIVERDDPWFLLEITVGKRVTYYLARKIPADFGTAYQLEKQDETGTAEVYYVNLHGLDGHHSCECRGFINHQHCRHVEGLLALQAAGRLPPQGELLAHIDTYSTTPRPIAGEDIPTSVGRGTLGPVRDRQHGTEPMASGGSWEDLGLGPAA